MIPKTEQTGTPVGKIPGRPDDKFPHASDEFPDELKHGPWVGCDFKKAPKIIIDGRVRAASSTGPDTWRPYEEVLAAYSMLQQ